MVDFNLSQLPDSGREIDQAIQDAAAIVGSSEGRDLVMTLARDGATKLTETIAGTQQGRAIAAYTIDTQEGHDLTIALAKTHLGQRLAVAIASTSEGRNLARYVAGTSAGQDLAIAIANMPEGPDMAGYLASVPTGQDLALSLVRLPEGQEFAVAIAFSDGGERLAGYLTNPEGRHLARTLIESSTCRQLSLFLVSTSEGRDLAQSLSTAGKDEESNRVLVVRAAVYLTLVSQFSSLVASSVLFVVGLATLSEDDDEQNRLQDRRTALSRFLLDDEIDVYPPDEVYLRREIETIKHQLGGSNPDLIVIRRSVRGIVALLARLGYDSDRARDFLTHVGVESDELVEIIVEPLQYWIEWFDAVGADNELALDGIEHLRLVNVEGEFEIVRADEAREIRQVLGIGDLARRYRVGFDIGPNADAAEIAGVLTDFTTVVGAADSWSRLERQLVKEASNDGGTIVLTQPSTHLGNEGVRVESITYRNPIEIIVAAGGALAALLSAVQHRRKKGDLLKAEKVKRLAESDLLEAQKIKMLAESKKLDEETRKAKAEADRAEAANLYRDWLLANTGNYKTPLEDVMKILLETDGLLDAAAKLSLLNISIVELPPDRGRSTEMTGNS